MKKALLTLCIIGACIPTIAFAQIRPITDPEKPDMQLIENPPVDELGARFEAWLQFAEDVIMSFPREDRPKIIEMWKNLPLEEKKMILQQIMELPQEEREAMFRQRIVEMQANQLVVPGEVVKPVQNQPLDKNAKVNVKDTQKAWYLDWNAWAVILALIALIGAVFGFLMNKRKSNLTTRYFKDIDTAYETFRMKGYRCEAELYRMRDIISEDFKSGKMNEGAFQLLDSRIEKYLTEIRENIINEKFGGMPESLKNSLQQMLASGEITESEFNKFHGLVDKSTLSTKDKNELNNLVKEWTEQDKK